MCPNCGGDWSFDLANRARMEGPYLKPGDTISYPYNCSDCGCGVIGSCSGIAGVTEVYDLNDPEVRAQVERARSRKFLHIDYDAIGDADMGSFGIHHAVDHHPGRMPDRTTGQLLADKLNELVS